jgi:hypothetical protein
LADIIFPDIETAAATFGEAARAYGGLVNDIAPYLLRETYEFEENGEFARKACDPVSGHIYARQTYWSEMLARAHMTSVAAIFRTTRWADSIVREYGAGNLFGWASASRSLIEAAGDIAFSLSDVPLTLASLNRAIIEQLSSKLPVPSLIARELEDALIHFSHARKISKTEGAPVSHKARQSAEYVGYIEKMNIDGARDLYSLLCELVHPAASSVEVLFSGDGRSWAASTSNEQIKLNALVKKNREIMGGILQASYNPPIITLRVLHRFDRFTQIPSLKRWRFDDVPIWRKIEEKLRT